MISLLSSESLAILGTAKPHAAFFNLMAAELFDARHTHGPYKLLPSTAGGYVVFDTRAPLGAGVVSVHAEEDDADGAMRELIP